MNIDERARQAYDLAREIEDLREAADVMPMCERMDLLRSLDRKEEALRRLMLQPAPPTPPSLPASDQ